MLQPVADAGVRVVIASLYERGLATLFGKVTVADEAERAVEFIRSIEIESPTDRIFLAGHSRGGQAAFRAASLVPGDELAGLILLDPVDGQGRNPSSRTATATETTCTVPTLIIGAGISGRCAPEGVNHVQFAEASPRARYVMVSELGHADMLDDRARNAGRRLCGGSDQPDVGRQACTELLTWCVVNDCAEELRDWVSEDVRAVVSIIR